MPNQTSERINGHKALLDTYAEQGHRTGNWQSFNDLLANLNKDPDFEAEAIAHARNLEAHYQQETANAYEAKRASGPTPVEISSKDLNKRLEALGINRANLHQARSAYRYAVDILGKNPNLTEKEITEALRVRGLHPTEIDAMEPFFKTIDKVVKADLGLGSPDQEFPDAESRRNFMKANHFSDADIIDVENSHPTPASGGFTLPEKAKEFAYESQDKEIKRRQNFQNKTEEQQQIDTVQQHTADSLPGQTQEKSAQQLHQIAGNLAVHAYGQGNPKFIGKRFADKTPEEVQAEQLTKEIDPNRADRKERLYHMNEVLTSSLGSKGHAKAKPYLDKATADFAGQHEALFGDIEKRDRTKLYDEAVENYLDKVAPSIKQKFMTTGVKSHGGIGKAQSEYRKDELKKLQSAIDEKQAGNRRASIGATLGNQSSNLQAATLAGDLSAKDADRTMAGVAQLEGMHHKNEEERIKHAGRIGSIGEIKRAESQAKLDLAHKEFEADKSHAERSARLMSDIAHGNPIAALQPPKDIERPKQTGKATTAAGLMGAAPSFFKSAGLKTGGRVTKAIGGPIDPQEAVNSAVTQGTSPSYEMNRLNNKYVTNAAHLGYMSARNAHRQTLATGGAVGPIAEGINKAKQVADNDKDEEDIRHQILAERKKSFTPEVEEKPGIISEALRGFMAGAGATGNNDWIARGGRAYTVGADRLDTQDAVRKAAKAARRKELADLGKQHMDEYNEKGKRAISEKELGLKGQELDLHKTHYAAWNKKLDAETAKLSREGTALSKEGAKTRDAAFESLRTGAKMARLIRKGHSLLGEVQTNPATGKLAQVPIIGPYLASKYGKGTAASYQKLNTLGSTMVLNAHQTLKNIPRNEAFVKRIEETKFSPDKLPEANDEALGLMSLVSRDSLDYGREQLLNMGVPPEQVDAYIEKYMREDNDEDTAFFKPPNSNKADTPKEDAGQQAKKAEALRILEKRGALG